MGFKLSKKIGLPNTKAPIKVKGLKEFNYIARKNASLDMPIDNAEWHFVHPSGAGTPFINSSTGENAPVYTAGAIDEPLAWFIKTIQVEYHIPLGNGNAGITSFQVESFEASVFQDSTPGILSYRIDDTPDYTIFPVGTQQNTIFTKDDYNELLFRFDRPSTILWNDAQNDVFFRITGSYVEP